MKKTNKVKIGLIQMRCSPDPVKNFARAVEQCKKAARKGAQIICLPELFRTRYFCQTENHAAFDLAESIPGPSTNEFSKLARKLGVVIIASLFEKRSAGLYHNTAVVIDANGSIAGMYRKMHIPDDPGFYEKFYFTPGDLGFKTFQTKFARIGVLICWDQWYPEAARLTALQGAQIIFYPTAIGWDIGDPAQLKKRQHDGWETVQRGHAIANEVYVAAVNRTGREDSLDFWGASFACGPFGDKITVASHKQEEILIAECDLARIECVRRHWPFLRDRRIDAFAPITQRFIDKK
ncbi:MAG: carbon-nitrogen hydrolase [Verrucomicrobiota bacterium]